MKPILPPLAALLLILAGPAFAQNEPGSPPPADPAAAPEAGAPAEREAGITIELNKLEAAQDACRGYFVVDNRTPEAFKELQIDVFLFDKADVILRRVGLTFLDVRSGRTKVVLFDLAGLACGDIGRFLLNEVLVCTAADGTAIDGCADRLAVRTRAEAQFQY